jgi:site-specific recombinase XerD
MNTSSLQSLIQRFFTDRLLKQLGASPHTIASYRDAFRLLLQFASERLGRAPSELHTEDFDASFLAQFLDHLELKRGNCTRTRNNRLAAVHAFFQYVAVSEPALALHSQRVLAIPSKRYKRGPVEYLTEEETTALVAAPNPSKWIGRRDKALLLVAVQTGLRNSEITSLRRRDVEFGTGAHVRCVGKGQDAVHSVTSGRRRGAKGMVNTAARRARWSYFSKLEWRAPQRRRVAAPRVKTRCYCASVMSIAHS